MAPSTTTAGPCPAVAPYTERYALPFPGMDGVYMFPLSPLYTLIMHVHQDVESDPAFFSSAARFSVALLHRPYRGAPWTVHPSAAPRTFPVLYLKTAAYAPLSVPWTAGLPADKLHPWPLVPPTSPPATAAVYRFIISGAEGNDDDPGRASARILTVDCGANSAALWPLPGGAPTPIVGCSMALSAPTWLAPNRMTGLGKFIITTPESRVACASLDHDRAMCFISAAIEHDELVIRQLIGRAVRVSGTGLTSTVAVDGGLFNITDPLVGSEVHTLRALPASPNVAVLLAYKAPPNEQIQWHSVYSPSGAMTPSTGPPRGEATFSSSLAALSPSTIGPSLGIELVWTSHARDTVLVAFGDEDRLWAATVLTCSANPGANFSLTACSPKSELEIATAVSRFQLTSYAFLTPAEMAAAGPAVVDGMVTASLVSFLDPNGVILATINASSSHVAPSLFRDEPTFIAANIINEGVAVPLSLAPLEFAWFARGSVPELGNEEIHDRWPMAGTLLVSNPQPSLPSLETRTLPLGLAASIALPIGVTLPDMPVAACVDSAPAGTSVVVAFDPDLPLGEQATVTINIPPLAGGKLHSVRVRVMFPDVLIEVPVWIEPAPRALSSPALIPLAQGATLFNVTISGLEPDTLYVVTMALHAGSGYGPFSAATEVKTLPDCALGTVPSIDDEACVACEAGEYGALTPSGLQTCLRCPDTAVSSRGAASMTDCICPGSAFLTASKCVACPRGGLCTAALGPYPYPAPGYFDATSDRSVSESSGVGYQFVACPLPEACLGGRAGCAVGYTGFACARCADGYFVTPSRECRTCPPGAGGTVFAVILLVVGLAAGYTLLSFLAATFPWELTLARQTGVGAEAQSYMVRRLRAPPSLRLTVVTIQCVGMLATVRFGLPDSLQGVLLAAHATNLDPALFAIECTIPSFVARYILVASFPVVILVVACGMCFVIALTAASFPILKAKYAPSAGASLRALLPALLERVVLTLGPLLYIPLVRSSLAFLDCSALPAGRGYFVDADPSLACYSSEWWALFPAFLASATIYGLGLPGYIVFRLRQSSGRLTQLGVIARYGCVYQPFRRPTFFFAPIMLARSAGMVAATLFFSSSPVWVAALALIITQGWMMTIIRWRPHFEPLHNSLELGYGLALTSLVLLCLVFLAVDRPSAATVQFFEVAGVCCVLAVAAAGLLVAVYEAIAIFRVKAQAETSDHGGGTSGKLGPAAKSRLNMRELVVWHTFLREVDDFDNEELAAQLHTLLADLHGLSIVGSVEEARSRLGSSASTGAFGLQLRKETDDFAGVGGLDGVELTSMDAPVRPVRPTRELMISREAPARPMRPARPAQHDVAEPARPARKTTVRFA
ncbi:uncharacterized protein AMSG_10377 [Thecamonas trahens ATCC 50062]|uniref:DUF7630 domain-containing protein n=1 Tax=Thecamonas trahens ATCC 50062 TaxID=461836 RepID=A0A0L0DR86_THETB|nr:hypothetical protein AMSG_10377 [Thecamonas trahens ATCC 50062]KNC54531.1 hypothetical protein AMSG_10377 [Thecamonas trahens ATCC 50062]|eukprot:XP_013753548.1 hypothetical protein AMSG_10377 [Thecamonas trahens ATCC 50062]